MLRTGSKARNKSDRFLPHPITLISLFSSALSHIVLKLANMTAPPKGSDPNNVSSNKHSKVKQHPTPKKGTPRNSIPPAYGDFALPPPTPVYFEEDGLRKVKPYMSVDLLYLPFSRCLPRRSNTR